MIGKRCFGFRYYYISRCVKGKPTVGDFVSTPIFLFSTRDIHVVELNFYILLTVEFVKNVDLRACLCYNFDMEQEDLKKLITSNIAKYRKQLGLTQAELAERLNYSDKAVSKWERGDGIPDVLVLCEMAEIFGITLNDFVSASAPKKVPVVRRNKAIVTLLSVGLVWLVATIGYVMMAIALPDFQYKWMAFIYAIPVSAIVLIVFSCMWYNKFFQFVSVSTLIWTIILSLHLSLLFVSNIGLIYLIGVPLQVLVVFWYLKAKRTKE